MDNKPVVVIAVLCFNESRTIGSVVLKAKKVADQVVVINDGSWDDSLEIAKAAGAIVISHEHNRGYGAATQSALRYGHSVNCDVLVTIDGDGQHNTEDILSLIKPVLEDKVDIAIGSRFMSYKNMAPVYRQFGQKVFTIIGNLLFRQKISDNQCGLRAFGKRAIRALDLSEWDMSISLEIHQQIARYHLSHTDVPVRVTYE